MSNIEELQARVVSAEARLALIGEEHQRYSDRLVSLMNAAEAQISEQSAAAAMHQAALDTLHQENEQLRTMLHTLLLAVEAGNGKALAATMHDLEAKFSAMLATKAEGETAVDAAPDAEAAAPAAGAAETDAELTTPAPEDADGEVMAVEDETMAPADPETGIGDAELTAPAPDDVAAEALAVEDEVVETDDDETDDDEIAADDAAAPESMAPAEVDDGADDALDATMSDGLDATGDAADDPLAMTPADVGATAHDEVAAVGDAEDEIAFEEEPMGLEAEASPAAMVEDAPATEAQADLTAGDDVEVTDLEAPVAEMPDDTPAETAEPVESAEATEADDNDILVLDDTEPGDAPVEAVEATDAAAAATSADDGDNAADALLAMHAEDEPPSDDLGFADAPPAADDKSPMKQILHGVRQQLADSDRSAAIS